MIMLKSSVYNGDNKRNTTTTRRWMQTRSIVLKLNTMHTITDSSIVCLATTMTTSVGHSFNFLTTSRFSISGIQQYIILLPAITSCCIFLVVVVVVIEHFFIFRSGRNKNKELEGKNININKQKYSLYYL